MNENNYIHRSRYFYGHAISPYGMQHGYIDYRTLCQTFNMVLNNRIMSATAEIGYWEEYNGSEYDPDTDVYIDVYQTYIIDERDAELLARYTDEIVWYNDELDMYVWGITHYGTSWDYVLTDIPVKLEEVENHD